MTRSGGTSSDWQVGSSFVSGMLLHAIRLISPELRPLSLQCRLVTPCRKTHLTRECQPARGSRKYLFKELFLRHDMHN